MKCINIFLSVTVVLFGCATYILFPPPFKDLCDVSSYPCPIGKNICKDFYDNKLTLEYKSFSDLFYNILSAKNVYFAKYNGDSVVVKQTNTCKDFLSQNYVKNIVSGGSEQQILRDFKVCDDKTYKQLLDDLSGNTTFGGLHEYVGNNAEPILLSLFPSKHGWPVPYYYGCCGKLTVMENSGTNLNHFESSRWIERAYISWQILNAAFNFTFSHKKYRLYLTDISPDNICIDDDLKVSFVDLENGLLAENYNGSTNHRTVHFYGEENFLYSEQEICSSSISDHNIYAVCRLLLSKDAPWPMMKNGLLHSPPQLIMENYSSLFSDIELCVTNLNNRFEISIRILNILLDILKESVYKTKL